MDIGNLAQLMWKYLSCEKLHKICQLVPTLQIREQLYSQYLVFFFAAVHTFSMDIELRNDRIPRNPFDRQFLDMGTLTNPPPPV